jgi:betaine-aldehyde dehydrogenase
MSSCEGESVNRLDALAFLEPVRKALFYGGAWNEAVNPSFLDITNPSDGTSLGQVVNAGAEDVERAIGSAWDARNDWRRTRPSERARILKEAAGRLRDNQGLLAALDAVDAGLPVTRVAGDVTVAALQLEYFAGLISEMKGETLPTDGGSLNYTLREPLGVVVRIHPFNHPLMFAAGKVAAALAAGNTVIGKPADQTPLSALALALLWADLFPPGVFNILTGDRATGAALVSHPKVAKVGVIGSVPTGRAVMRSVADTLKKVTLELGGKNALIAYPDADPRKVAAAAVEGMNFAWTAGQSCGSTTRIFLHQKIHDAVVAEMTELMESIRLGIPSEQDCQMGCLISPEQQSKVLDYIRIGKNEGAILACGGGTPKEERLRNGYFVEPTLFTGVTPEMRIAREEIFGPVVSAIRWGDEDAMFEAVNGLDYGLTASIWTTDLVNAHRAASRVEAGYIWINSVASHFLGAPFGGYKQSGLGREECLDELLAYTQIKNVNIPLAS